MPLTFKSGKTPAAVISTLSQADKRVTAAAQAEFEKGAKQIQMTARMFAPVDEGDLESAIKASAPRRSGPNAQQIKVYVSAQGRDRGDVDKYAKRMHEGSYNLGPKSIAKAMALGVVVGPKYLTRAAQKLFPVIQKAVAAAIQRSVK